MTTAALSARVRDSLDGAKGSASPLAGLASEAQFGTLINEILTRLLAAEVGGGGGLVALASTANGEGASLVGVEDAAATLAGATVEAALVELSARVRTQMVTFTLTAAAEVADVIAVTVNLVDLAGVAVSRAQRFMVQAFKADMTLASSAEITLAETGTGSEVSTTAKPVLVAATDASGDAVISVTDVAGGSGLALFLVFTPVQASGTYTPGTPVMVAVTFDGV